MKTKKKHIFDSWYFFNILLPFFIIWFCFAFYNDLFVTIPKNFFMSLTMAIGSFIAGATSEGGGAVAFPVMTIVFSIPPEIARNFSLLIQSFGMTAASLTIIRHKIQIEWNTIKIGSLSGIVGFVIGALLIAPNIVGVYAKLFFTSLWLSFGLVLWRLKKTKRSVFTKIKSFRIIDQYWLIFLAFIGGAISSIIGSGIDIVIFSTLTLRYNLGEDIATPTSVILMSIISIFASFFHCFILKDITFKEIEYIVACAPVVIIGAPLGAWFISYKSRNFIAKLLIFILIIQYVGAIFTIQPGINEIIFSFIIFFLGTFLFNLLASSKGLIHKKYLKIDIFNTFKYSLRKEVF